MSFTTNLTLVQRTPNHDAFAVQVQDGSCAAASGIKEGDQVNQPMSHLSLTVMVIDSCSEQHRCC